MTSSVVFQRLVRVGTASARCRARALSAAASPSISSAAAAAAPSSSSPPSSSVLLSQPDERDGRDERDGERAARRRPVRRHRPLTFTGRVTRMSVGEKQRLLNMRPLTMVEVHRARRRAAAQANARRRAVRDARRDPLALSPTFWADSRDGASVTGGTAVPQIESGSGRMPSRRPLQLGAGPLFVPAAATAAAVHSRKSPKLASSSSPPPSSLSSAAASSSGAVPANVPPPATAAAATTTTMGPGKKRSAGVLGADGVVSLHPDVRRSVLAEMLRERAKRRADKAAESVGLADRTAQKSPEEKEIQERADESFRMSIKNLKIVPRPENVFLRKPTTEAPLGQLPVLEVRKRRMADSGPIGVMV
jgi:hypothetical protein